MPNIVFVGIVLVFLAASFRIAFFYYLLYFVVLSGLLARLWIWRAWKQLEVRREFTDHVFLDEVVTLRLTIAARGRLPVPWLRVEDRLPTRLTPQESFRAVISLLPREARTLEYRILAHRRGYFPIGPLRVDLGDVFGFHTRSLATTAPSYLTVYPKILPLEKLLLPSKTPFGSVKAQEILYEDPSRVVGVRDYARGDSLRKVNWKATANVGRLQVKKYEPAITLDTMFFLNLDLDEYDVAFGEAASELAISVTASLANHLAERRQPVGLVSNGHDGAAPVEPEPERARGLGAPQPWEIDRRGVEQMGFAVPESRPVPERPPIAVPAGKGRAHLMRVLEALARAQARHGYPVSSLLRQQAVRLPWGSTVVVVTWGRAFRLVEALVGLRKLGYNVVVVLVRFGMRDTFPAELVAMGFRVHEVRREEDATLFAESRVIA